MTGKKRVLSGLLVSLAVLTVIIGGLGAVNGQILSEQTYFEEDFNEYNESSVQLSPPDQNLNNQYLISTGEWSTDYYSIGRDHGGTPNYGDQSPYSSWGLDTTYPYLQTNWQGDYTGTVGMEREITVPEGMENPVLVVEHADYHQDRSGNGNDEIAVYNPMTNTGQAITSNSYDNVGDELRRMDSWSRSDFDKVGTIPNQEQRAWTTSAFEIDPSANNVTLVRASEFGDSGSNNDGEIYFRQIYWAEGSGQAFQTEVNGFEAVPEDDSFGGPDAYPLHLVTEPTADGQRTSLRADGQTITREFSLDGIDDAQKSYFVLEGTSHSQHPVQYTIEAYGQEVASGAINPESSSEETVELDLNTHEVTVTVQSEGQYDIHNVGFSALEETSQGDPLSKSSQPGGITLDPDKGYDSTIGLLVSGLNLTTDTLLYVVMIAITVGFMVFSFTKSVRGQEFAQSLLFGAVVAGVVIVGVVPTMNVATWIFSGGVDRAPLADPALEAEPPTYYSTEFQDGTMHGWSYDNARAQGSVRPVSVGETFDLRFSGNGQTPGIITHQEHISLGNSLDTGFVNIDGAAEGTAGYNQNPHEVTYNVRVYVTSDGNLDDSQKLDPDTNYVENDQSARQLRNPVTSITEVEANVGGEERDLSSDFTIVDAGAGIIQYNGNETLANDENLDETLDRPTVRYETLNEGSDSESPNTLEPGDTFEVSKTETSQSVAAVEEVARSFDGETMSNEQMVTFDLNGEYVHTELIVRSNRDDENPVGTLTSVRVGATTEGGSTQH